MAKEQLVEGTVIELRDFGAMIDLGHSITGMLHISELSYSRLGHPSEALQVGQSLRVKVLSVEDSSQSSANQGSPRIALSLKQAMTDPWTTVQDELTVGDSYQGVVTRLAAFGAFVEIKPGLEGLIHLSEMSWIKRVLKPSEVVSVGDQVSCRLLAMDPDKRRLSLSLKSVDEDPWAGAEKKFR